MKWYGLKHFSKNKLIYNFKKKKNLKNKKNLSHASQKVNLTNYVFNFYLPFGWDFIFFKKTNKIESNYLIYIYNDQYFFFLPLKNKFLEIYYNKLIKIITFTFLYKNNFYNVFWNKFKFIFFSFNKFFFKKIKFKGKGYYIYKNYRNTVALQFGYSHIKRLYFYFTCVKFLSKTSILIFGINLNSVNKTARTLFDTRTINIFTGKGMRFTRQIIYRKTGKISSYR